MSDSAMETVRAFWERCWSGGEPELAATLFAPGALENGDPVDPEEFAQGVARWTTELFQEFSATIEELVPLPDGRVLSRVTYRGIHTGKVFNIPATGRPVEALGIDIFRVVDGRIVELWHATDHLELVVQIGGTVVPKER